MAAPNYLSPHCASGNCSFCRERRRRVFERDFPLLAQPAPGYFGTARSRPATRSATASARAILLSGSRATSTYRRRPIKMKIKLVVYLKGGRELSGTYDYLSALARLQFAAALPDYLGFDLLDAV